MKPTVIASEPVSAYDAKTNLSRLLEGAARGQRFVITRHGKPIAQLIPFDEAEESAVRAALDKVHALRAQLEREGVTLTSVLEEGESVRELSHDGHRY